jgi:hypothetical protein
LHDSARLSWLYFAATSPLLPSTCEVVLQTQGGFLVDSATCTLAHLHQCTRGAGWLVTASAYDWDARVAEPKLWLGGRAHDDDARDAIGAALGPGFTNNGVHDVPLWTRCAARLFELQIVNVLTWRHAAQQSSA